VHRIGLFLFLPLRKDFSNGVFHHLDAQRAELWPVAVHAEFRAHAHLQHDGRPELCARQLLHGGRLRRLHRVASGRLLARAGDRAAGGRRPGRRVRAPVSSPGAQVRPCAGAADHLRSVLCHSGTGAAHLGPHRRRVSAARAAAGPGLHADQPFGQRSQHGLGRCACRDVQRRRCGGAPGLFAVPGHPRLHDAGGAGHAGVGVAAAHTHPHRSGHPGGTDPSRGGGVPGS
jgi:hypothetical protein